MRDGHVWIIVLAVSAVVVLAILLAFVEVVVL